MREVPTDRERARPAKSRRDPPNRAVEQSAAFVMLRKRDAAMTQPRKHPGPHHYAPCGEYRPTAANHECTDCPHVCPACGARYNRRPPSNHQAEIAHAGADELRDIVSKAKGDHQ